MMAEPNYNTRWNKVVLAMLIGKGALYTVGFLMGILIRRSKDDYAVRKELTVLEKRK